MIGPRFERVRDGPILALKVLHSTQTLRPENLDVSGRDCPEMILRQANQSRGALVYLPTRSYRQKRRKSLRLSANGHHLT